MKRAALFCVLFLATLWGPAVVAGFQTARAAPAEPPPFVLSPAAEAACAAAGGCVLAPRRAIAELVAAERKEAAEEQRAMCGMRTRWFD